MPGLKAPFPGPRAVAGPLQSGRYDPKTGKGGELAMKTLGFMAYVWHIIMGYLWDIYGIFMGYLRHIYGIFIGFFMGYVWDIYGIYGMVEPSTFREFQWNFMGIEGDIPNQPYRIFGFG